MQMGKMHPSEFDAVYDILENSFPPDEYRPYAEQKALLSDARYTIYVLRDDAETVCGMLAVWDLERFIFIEHFAVAPAVRNGGYGTMLLRFVQSQQKKPLCLEVEPPETALTARRVAFYKRNGFYFNRYDYMQPPISKGKNPVRLFLMTAPHAVDEPTFTAYKETLYREVYHCI